MSRHRGPYRTSDGWLAVVVYTDAHWRAFSALVGIPGLLDTDPRFANLQARTVNAEACGQLLAGYFGTRSTDDWIAALRGTDLPCGRVNTLDSLPADPHVREVGLFSTVQHPTEGALRQSRFPVRFSSSPASVRRHAPRLGEHTEEVLAEVRSRRRARRPTGGDQ
jgi:crotonobetainyl-CoA:carnitine CoA-transferase CaiB-like acyl-CoA transferase